LSAYSGFVKKSEIKAWLRYFVNTPLYREEDITVDKEFLRDVKTDEKLVDF